MTTTPTELPKRNAVPYDIRSLELVRRFVERMETGRESAGAFPRSPTGSVDWTVINASIAGSATLEEAIGRAVVMADRMCRGVVAAEGAPDGDRSQTDGRMALASEDQFFSFSLTDAVPDFGDRSRYRTRMARRLTGVFGSSERA